MIIILFPTEIITPYKHNFRTSEFRTYKQEERLINFKYNSNKKIKNFRIINIEI
jgi:hypothetical protein